MFARIWISAHMAEHAHSHILTYTVHVHIQCTARFTYSHPLYIIRILVYRVRSTYPHKHRQRDTDRETQTQTDTVSKSVSQSVTASLYCCPTVHTYIKHTYRGVRTLKYQLYPPKTSKKGKTKNMFIQAHGTADAGEYPTQLTRFYYCPESLSVYLRRVNRLGIQR